MKVTSLILSSFFILAMCSPFCGTAQVKDIDGNIYKTVKIGNQIWMAENLKVTHFRNGDPVPEAPSKEGWNNAMNNRTPAWSHAESNPNNFYNAYTITDPRGLAPEGWHIPSVEEWGQLISYLGEESAGQKLKSISGWQTFDVEEVCPNCINWSTSYRNKVPCDMCKDNRKVIRTYKGDGTNTNGFNGIPVGIRVSDYFKFKSSATYFGSAGISDKYGFRIFKLESDKTIVQGWMECDDLCKFHIGSEGISIRCIKNAGSMTTKQIEENYTTKPTIPKINPFAGKKIAIKDLDPTIQAMISYGILRFTENDMPALVELQDYCIRLDKVLDDMIKGGYSDASNRESQKRSMLLGHWSSITKNVIDKKEIDEYESNIRVIEENKIKETKVKEKQALTTQIKNAPLSSAESNFVGKWTFESKNIYSKNGDILIFEETFLVNSDRTYSYESKFRKWLDKNYFGEYKEKGSWELKDNIFIAYINEENGKPSDRIDKLQFDNIGDKKASRTLLFTGVEPVKIIGKKVPISSFDDNTMKSILEGTKK